ncbi:MAG: holo-ACP synthase [Alphaproteobacteria bacterium]|nr:holo-ACP synthase [Alphaproteobacteria bacterium]
MIIGVGVDIVDTRRINSLLLKFQNRFIDKIFTQKESEYCLSKKDPSNYFAKMFSIKEATIKAISDSEGMSWHDMEISHNDDGKPIMTLSGNALRNLRKKTQNFNIEISTSDERDYAIGFAIIESV